MVAKRKKALRKLDTSHGKAIDRGKEDLETQVSLTQQLSLLDELAAGATPELTTSQEKFLKDFSDGLLKGIDTSD